MVLALSCQEQNEEPPTDLLYLLSHSKLHSLVGANGRSPEEGEGLSQTQSRRKKVFGLLTQANRIRQGSALAVHRPKIRERAPVSLYFRLVDTPHRKRSPPLKRGFPSTPNGWTRNKRITVLRSESEFHCLVL